MADTQNEKDRIQREIERQEIKRHQLDLALGEFLHEGRRTRDGLERLGGHSRALEAKARALKKNVKLTRKDLDRTEREIAALHRRLAEIADKTQRQG